MAGGRDDGEMSCSVILDDGMGPGVYCYPIVL